MTSQALSAIYTKAAFTVQTLSDFAIPSIGASADVTVSNADLFVLKQPVFLGNFDGSKYGMFEITAIDGSLLTLKTISAVGTGSILAGSKLSPGGFSGAPGSGGSDGLPPGGTAGQALVKIDGVDYNAEWATLSSGGTTSTTVAFNTGSLANGATATGTIALPTTYLIKKIVSTAQCRMRLYVSSAKRTADAARASTTRIQGDHGCFIDAIVPAGLTRRLAPLVTGETDSNTGYISVTNTSGLTATITVTLTYLPLEA